jgi:hypothetical protein
MVRHWRATRSRNSRSELIADDEQSVVLATRSSTWAWNRPSGGGAVPPQGLVVVRPYRTDRFRHALENAYWAPSILCSGGKRWRGRDRRKLSFNDEEITRLTSRSCGEFPGIGRTLPSRHLRSLMVIKIPRIWLRTVALPARASAPFSNRSSGSKCVSGPASEALSSGLVWEALPWAAARISPPGDTVR